MNRHLVVYVKSKDLQEFIEKLDSKGWAVMDIEPKTRINFVSIIVGIIGAICVMLHSFDVINDKIAPYVGAFVLIAFLASLGFSFVHSYTVICEYTGNDEYIDMTPFDDTDDEFVKNESYDPSINKSDLNDNYEN